MKTVKDNNQTVKDNNQTVKDNNQTKSKCKWCGNYVIENKLIGYITIDPLYPNLCSASPSYQHEIEKEKIQ